MNVKLLSIELIDFKGVRNAKYEFGDRTKISAENGAGKTTIADGFYWLFTDKNYALASNPNIRPNDGRECTPTVIAELDIDGKPVTVAKMQKCKVGKPDENGVSKISLTNTYEINSVPKSERDFKEYLSDLGVDFDKFLQLSHPDVFVAGMNEKKAREQMRNTLFEMAGTISDLEIAKMSAETSEVAALFENYTKEEIEAMQNSTLRKIKENYGKEGEILRAKIEGLESAKVDTDTAELELGKKAVMELIKSNKAKQDDVSKQYEEYQKLSDGILELQFELNDLQRKANEENNRKRREIEDKISDKKFLVRQTEKTICDAESLTEYANHNIFSYRERLESSRTLWKAENERVFDENSLICSYCGQEYPIEKKEQLRADFESHKAEELKRITEAGNKAKADLDKEKETLSRLESELPQHRESLEMLNSAIAELEKQLSELPQSIDISEREDVKAIKGQSAEKEQAMNSGNSADEIRSQLKAELEELQAQYNEFDRQIAKASNNIAIDEQIADLRAKQGEYEQSKADCEKILYQLSLVSRKKNEMLTEEINKHFKIVKWRLFTFQKNGGYLDDCTPTIDGKDFKDETNCALKTLAKLDIVDGLQKFFGQSYPVFIDDFEHITSNTSNRIDMNCQLIMLSAMDGVKELKVEVF